LALFTIFSLGLGLWVGTFHRVYFVAVKKHGSTDDSQCGLHVTNLTPPGSDNSTPGRGAPVRGRARRRHAPAQRVQPHGVRRQGDRRAVGRAALTPGGCQIGYMCDQNSTYGLHSLPGGVRLATCATITRLMGCTHSQGVSDWLHGQYWLSSMCFARHSRVSEWLHGQY
jgi:hypothetical protein